MGKQSRTKKQRKLERIDAIIQTMINDGTIAMQDGSIYGQDLEVIRRIATAIDG